MKVIGILVLAFVLLWLWNQGVFTYLMPSVIAKEKLSKEYGGVYVFYPEFREEIKKRERERDELAEKLRDEITSKPRQIKGSDGKWKTIYDTDFTRINEALPQTLSNGCKYHNQAFGPYDAIFEPYYEKIKEFVGEEVYKRLKPFLKITSFYRCEDGSEGLITVWTDIGTTKREFGIFGDEGRGFFLSKRVGVDIGGSNTFELREGKFKKMNKKYEGWD